MPEMRVLDLFSGIGGFSLGLERAGMQTVAFCEIEKFPRQVLKKHWPEVPIYDDIRKLTAERLRADGIGPIDLVCGGFPCQPFSHAGKRRGTADDRDLWPEMFRVIKDVQPRWICAENAFGLASMGQPIGHRTVESKTFQRLADQDYYHKVFTQEELMLLGLFIEDLESAGYRLPEALDGTPIVPVIPAGAVDAPHQRARVWIVAHREGERRRETGAGVERSAQRPTRGGDAPDSESVHAGGLPERTQPPITELRIGRENGNVPDPFQSRLEGAEREKLAGPGTGRGRSDADPAGPDWWSTEPDVGRVAHGVPQRVDRLKGLGNAVVPQVVEAIGRAIMEADKQFEVTHV